MFTIVIPTHNHEDTIQLAIQSVLQQSYQSFEIFVVADGAGDRTKKIVKNISSKDSRVIYFENPKGQSHGEIHRHNAIRQASGRYIAYLGDDDLWLPNHLETLEQYLENYDFVQSAQATIQRNGHWHVYAGDLNNHLVQNRMLKESFNFFGPTTVAHRLDSYQSLPHGWRPKPDNMYSDLHMWRQWLTQEKIQFKSLFKITSLHLGSPTRLSMSNAERAKEMQIWLNKINSNHQDFYDLAQTKLLESWNQQINEKFYLPSGVYAIAKMLLEKSFSAIRNHI